ncbi:MAG: TonB-dependent receptor [Pseudomonadota bacterium]|nr:TonB-dependent receptor [Pseudomonadota bacterium]
MRLQLFAVLAGLVAVAPAPAAERAQSAPRSEVDDVYRREAQFQIPAQPLATALIAFSDQAHLQVISSGDEVAKSFATEVRGRRRVIDALAVMLKGTQLRYTVLNGDTISIHPKRPVRTAEAAPRAHTQATDPERDDGSADEDIFEVVVTATRVVRDGYEAPTPTTVMSTETLKVLAASNMADAVNFIPALAGSATPRSGNSGVSGGQSGTNTLDLRSMGANRTLVLLDGARLAPTALTGVVDINQLPDGLIKRVDVVTGGASAAYGSDAMTGVVNFVLDKDFTGFKSDALVGVTDHGDGGKYQVSLTAGMPFGGKRGHVLFSSGFSDADGVRGIRRSWYRGWKVFNNPDYVLGNGQPELLLRPEGAISQATPGALVTAGPLRGTEFTQGGAVRQFQYGSIDSPPVMSGGDWRISDRSRTPDLEAAVKRQTFFARGSWQLTDDLQVFAIASYAHSETDNQCCYNYYLNNITVQRDNAFMPDSVRSEMQRLGLDTLTVGSTNEDLGTIHGYSTRDVKRFVAGLNGKFSVFGADWRWDAYAQRGTSNISNDVTSTITANYREAIDSVRDSSGRIVCRSTLTNPGNGCVPYNILGYGVNSQAAVDYVLGVAQLDQEITQDVTAVSAQSEPFSTWAGPVSLASGFEYRKESVTSHADPIAQASGYFVGNFKATRGSYDVIEAFIESVVPLVSSSPWAQALDLNGAVRWTDYSSSGEVITWKLGATYSPVSHLTFRGTRSRDIRAPNLNDLFLAGQVNTQQVSDPFRGNATALILRPMIGNLNLDPEEADTLGLGVVYQPAFAPGLSVSADYYRIDVDRAIATIQQQQVIDRCFAGNTALCSAIVRDQNGVVTRITVQPVNLLSETAEGIDIEASYRRALWSGNLTLRALATHVIERRIDDGIAVTELAGDNSGSAADWRWLAMASYDQGSYAMSLIGRGVSSGHLENAYIECTSSCPTPSVVNRTVDNNHIAGAVYADLSFTYRPLDRVDFRNLELFFKIDNVTDRDPPPVASIAGVSFVDPGANPLLYDTVGRTFRAGVRLQW